MCWLWCGKDGPGFWLDPSVEVAPFRMVAANLRGKPAFLLLPDDKENVALSRWLTVPVELPFAASQHVDVDATLSADGKLTAKVHYALRGDNELLLRVAFRQTAKEKWKDLAQLLSISDGFRGKVDSVSASDPAVTREPFAVDYEIAMPKFVDWSKKPVRIPALLPQVGLPDAPVKADATAATSAIDLGRRWTCRRALLCICRRPPRCTRPRALRWNGITPHFHRNIPRATRPSRRHGALIF